MIAVHVADENAMDSAALDVRPHQLELCPLAAVEEKHVAFANKSRGGKAASQRRHCGTGSQKDNLHDSSKLSRLPREHCFQHVPREARILSQAAHGIRIPVAPEGDVDP